MRAASPGYTLVEITVAMLILAMVASGVFSVVLTARTNQVRSDRQQFGVIYQRRLNDTLANLVGVEIDSGAVCKRICPGAATSCTGCPSLSGDTCGAHAFAESCTHDAGTLLPTWFKAAPYNGAMCYKVTTDTLNPSRPVKQVITKVTWEEGGCSIP